MPEKNTKAAPEKQFFRSIYTTVEPGNVYPFIPGVIVDIFVKKGDVIEKGSKLLSLHAMKMNNEICATIAGKIKNINVKKGQVVTKNDIIVEIVPID